VNKLNTKSAGKYIFSGSATSTRPLPDGQQILSQIKQDVSGINATSSFGVAIDDWFQAINGAYQASIYSGSEHDTIFTPIGVGKGVVSEVDASHEAITTLLKGLAKIAVVSDTVLQANASDQQNILKNGLEDISASMPMLRHVQSLIGVSQEHISSAIEENDAYLFIYEKSQNSLIGVDQYQRLSEHQAIQTQIGISYQILTWRAKNTLADYLR
jgi:flagellar hook-associated protein 3 FlgL